MKFPRVHPVEWAIAAALFGVIACVGFAPLLNAHALAAGPLLQDATAHGFTVVWWRSGGDPAELRVRGGPNAETVFPARRNGDRYEANAANLAPGIAYRYEILGVAPDGTRRRLATGRARTAPPPGSPFAFLAFADAGGAAASRDLARIMERYPRDVVLFAGDFARGRFSLDGCVADFLRPYRHLLRGVPLYPVLGNHDLMEDGGEAFLDTFSLPRNGPAGLPPKHCYWFDCGDARFVAIDSNLAPETFADRVVPWLREALATADRSWKFVFFHHVPRAGEARPADGLVCDFLVPALEAGGADVVFCGHVPRDERAAPGRAGRIVPASAGILYVASGDGDPGRGAGFEDSPLSFIWVLVESDRIAIERIGENGEILEEIARDRPAPPAVDAADPVSPSVPHSPS